MHFLILHWFLRNKMWEQPAVRIFRKSSKSIGVWILLLEASSCVSTFFGLDSLWDQVSQWNPLEPSTVVAKRVKDDFGKHSTYGQKCLRSIWALNSVELALATNPCLIITLLDELFDLFDGGSLESLSKRKLCNNIYQQLQGQSGRSRENYDHTPLELLSY